TAGYYEPKYDCTDFTSDMGAAYLQTDFKLADTKGGFDIRFRDGGQIKVFNVSGIGKTEVPNCGNTFIEVGEDARWYTLKFLYSFTTKFAYVNISNEDGVCFTSCGTLASGPSSMQKLELVVYSGSEVYFDNMLIKNIEEDEIPVPGMSKYYSFNDLESGDVIKTADKEDGSSAYYGWYHIGDGVVSPEEKDGKKAIVLETNDESDILVCEKLAVAADTIETDFMVENQSGIVSLQVAGSKKSYANVVSVADGKIVSGDEEICTFVPGVWYRAIIKKNSESSSVTIVNLETGDTSSVQWDVPSNVDVIAYGSFSVPATTKLYVDNFLAATEAKNISATVNYGKKTVVAQDGLVIKADICNIDPEASSATVNGETAIFDVTPWAGIKIKNLPKNETINVTYSIKDYNGNVLMGNATVETIDAYTFEDLDCYEENGDVFACVYGKVNVSGKTAKLIVAVYSDDGMVLEKVSILPILSSDSDECYTVRAGVDYDSSKHTIAAFLWGDDVFPIMAACK
ncbi:MAG: hypothetical protein IJB70_00945, partial [Clostridia bacterium]|nr:hypothetical protein [Clostridia bacterium]